VIQINGKVRSRVLVPAGSAEEVIRERAMADEKVRASLNGKQVVKAIVVPGKLVNIVVR
jgi:leucyl-tRNA synthetase